METFTNKIDFLRQVFGEVEIARDGVNVAVVCPICENKNGKKKFSINTETWNCHCWVCDIKGRNLFLILKKNFNSDVANRYRERFLKDDNRRNLEKRDDDIDIRLPDDFILLCKNFKNKDPDIKDCIRYLFKRGLTKKDFWYFKLGTSATGEHRRRVIIPSFDTEGKLNYFVSRSIDSDRKPKYINSKSNKLNVIFNEINLNWDKEVTIVEGPFDLFTCNQNSTCLLGSSLSEESYLFKKIASNRSPILLALDADMKSKTRKYADLLSSYCCNVRILDLGKFHDTGDMTKDEFRDKRKNSHKWSRDSSLMGKIGTLV